MWPEMVLKNVETVRVPPLQTNRMDIILQPAKINAFENK